MESSDDRANFKTLPSSIYSEAAIISAAPIDLTGRLDLWLNHDKVLTLLPSDKVPIKIPAKWDSWPWDSMQPESEILQLIHCSQKILDKGGM